MPFPQHPHIEKSRTASKHHANVLWQCALCFAILLLTTTCKTKQTIGQRPSEYDQKTLLSTLQEQAFSYKTLSARLYMNVETKEKSFSSRIELKAVQDSVIHLSVQPLLGFEAFRIEFNQDSLRVLDRLNKQYIAESYDKLKASFPVDLKFYNIQALLTNRLFLPNKRELSAKDYTLFTLIPTLPNLSRIKTVSKGGLRCTFDIDHTNPNIHQVYMEEPTNGYTLAWKYADFKAYDHTFFPETMEISIAKENKSIGNMRLSISRLQRNIPLRTEFYVSPKYKRMQLRNVSSATNH